MLRFHRTIATTSDRLLIISANAAKQINSLNSNKSKAAFLRVEVDSGGCHGYQYVMKLDSDIAAATDLQFEQNGAKVVVDLESIKLLEGSTLDYVDELIGSSFQIVANPKADSSCGCKISFNIK